MNDTFIATAIFPLAIASLLAIFVFTKFILRNRRFKKVVNVKNLYVSADITAAMSGLSPAMLADAMKTMTGKKCADYNGVPWGTVTKVFKEDDRIKADILIMPERMDEIGYLIAGMGGHVSIQHVSVPANQSEHNGDTSSCQGDISETVNGMGISK